jgi:hypothetical protein
MNLALLPPLCLVSVLVACSSSPPSPFDVVPPSLDVASPLRGVPDRGADPAVVLLDLGGDGLCSGALIGADVVLTARRCLSLVESDARCPASGPQVASARDLTTVRVLVGEDASSAVERARGRAALFPDGDVLCGADVALLMLDSTIDEVAPLVARATGAALGDHVRSVSYARGQKLVRDHVLIAATSSRELSLAEAPCDGAPGGPAIDEASGQLVGVLSRSGPACDATDGYDVATRADAFLPLIGRALAEGDVSHASHQARQKKGPVDVGASCVRGADCAAGVCADYAGAQYCTRACSSTDRCPSKYRCMASSQGPTACIQP